MMKNLYGSYVAIVTPMLADGSVDYKSLGNLIEFHIESGTHGIVAVGTTGESATIPVDEHIEVIDFTVKQAAGRIDVIAGTGGNSTNEALELTRLAAEVKADACLLVVPYYNKPTQHGLYQHYKTIADAVPISQILYNVPGRTVADLDNDTAVQLAEIDNIIGIKDATGDIARGQDLVERCLGKMDVVSGDDSTALAHMKVGGKGNISVTANVAPALMSQLCEAAINGDFAEADRLNSQLEKLNSSLFIESNPIPVKWALNRMGMIGEHMRLPMTQFSSQYHDQLEQALLEADISLPVA
ncbi:MAG: 4-hydroxy-tetrahydrodipicolinate synthase [Arenicella sp.]